MFKGKRGGKVLCIVIKINFVIFCNLPQPNQLNVKVVIHPHPHLHHHHNNYFFIVKQHIKVESRLSLPCWGAQCLLWKDRRWRGWIFHRSLIKSFIIIVVLIIMVKKEMSCRLYQEYFKPVHSCQTGRERYPLKNNDDVTRENVYLCDIIYRVSQLKQRMLLGPRCTRS